MGSRVVVLVVLMTLIGPLATPSVAAGALWKNTLQHPDDSFVHSEFDQGPGWVKFLILTSSPNTVYFQESNTYTFHYDFAVAELPQFSGMSPTAFDNVTLFASGQQAILGAVLIPPTSGGQHLVQEYGIQLVRTDPYSAMETRDILVAVRNSIVAAPQVQSFYMPAFEQLGVAQANESYFASEGFPVSDTGRWDDRNACYSDGWALGTLKFVTAGQIDAAFLSGQLTAQDILLTDGIPAEIPFLAGVVSLAPSTPNSHVALLAKTFNVPFTYLSLAGDVQKAQGLIGHRIALRVDSNYGLCEVKLVDTDGQLDQAQVDGLLALKAPPTLGIVPTETFGAYSASTNGLIPSDIKYFGGKATNSGILRQAIPTHSPVSTAFSFDLWNAYLDQPWGSWTLREEIAQRLAPFSYPPNVSALDSALNGIQDLFKDDNESSFTPALISAVQATLQDAQYGFDPNKKLRFRSSTNVEDSDQFTGAGLYDSFSGCLADDLDADTSGPSLCAPLEPKEKGVFRAIRKVFASFYNLNAYIERLRHDLNENDVGMALLVHHSFPDEIELANGVGTYTVGPGSNLGAYLVLQPGANSVTNPEPGQIPEEVDVYISSFSDLIWPTVLQESNLLLIGETVLVYSAEYVTLTEYLKAAAERYETVTGLAKFVLEFEFKKTAPADELIVTQVRQIPQPDDTPTITPFLLNEPDEYCTFQGEGGGTVFGNHRLKARWDIETLNMWLNPSNLAGSLLDEVSLDYLEGCMSLNQSGFLPTWPAFQHTHTVGRTDDSWTLGDLQNPRTQTLRVETIPELVAPSDSPLMLLADFGWEVDYTDNGCLPLTTNYAAAVPDVDFTGPITTVTDFTLICPCREPELADVEVHRIHTDQGITIDTRYFWPEPVEVAAGYTAPLKYFERTIITGLTTQSIVLTHENSQTYKPGHHNFSAEYLFEPALEPGISQQTSAELAALDVRAIYLNDNFGSGTITLISEAEWGYHCLPCRGPDGDGDGRCLHAPTLDCDDANPLAWAPPGEVALLRFDSDELVSWDPPLELGAPTVVYDTLRATDPSNLISASCVESNGLDTSTDAQGDPALGSVFFYLVAAENTCPAGRGSLGRSSAGEERQGANCP